MPTRKEFEANPAWCATIKRRDNIAFILEGQKEFNGRFYEYPDDWFSRYDFGPRLEREVEAAALRSQLESGQIKLLKGELP